MVEMWQSTPPADRSAIASSSPATCAHAYNETCRVVLTDMLGVRLSSNNRKDTLTGDHNLGIFGAPRAAHDVTEAQARGLLHIHLLLWLRHGPIFWARVVHYPEARKKLRKFIDDTVSGALSQEEHAALATEKPAATVLEEAPEIINGIETRGRVVVTTSNIHKHRARCRCNNIGKNQCALSRPCPCSSETTWHQLTVRDQSLDKSWERNEYRWEISASEEISEPPATGVLKEATPIPLVNGRIISLTLCRPKDLDGYVAKYSAILSCEVSSNGTVQYFGKSKDARSAVYYVVKNLSKSLCDLSECLPLLASARSNAAKFLSIAEDTGTDFRYSKLVLQKLLNTISGLQEYSFEQCAAAILDYISSHTTEISSYRYEWPAAKFLGDININCDQSWFRPG